MNETTATTDHEAHNVWVKVDSGGIIRGASVDDGTPESKRFLYPIGRGYRVLLVGGPVRMSAHITNPMVYPPEPVMREVEDLSLPLFCGSGR